MQRLITLCLSFLLLLSSSFLAQADTAFTQRKDVQRFINHMVKEYKFNRNELVAVMNSVQLQPQIIESMEKPFEKKRGMFTSNFF